MILAVFVIILPSTTAVQVIESRPAQDRREPIPLPMSDNLAYGEGENSYESVNTPYN